ncbi:cysteine protease atg4da-like [Acipenser ruthenus]|uniref:cysteine protease atg4da-like n=1 Tax=Acipenser ruthenus TaxID=7906 RepID=UPI00274255F2|nr:cysteine protease atg4da-like [Acipenser ruthenus]
MNSISPSSAQYLGANPEETLPPMGRKARSHTPRADGNHFLNGEESGQSSEPDEVDRIKAKLMSAWNNVKYGWTVKTKTHFSKTSPLILLGRSYTLHHEEGLERFRMDFVSRVWLTYRREFQQLEGSVLTSDCGWGCMLRSGQMLLAQGLLVHLLPPEWTWPDALQLTDVEMEPLRTRSPSRAGPLPALQQVFTVQPEPRRRERGREREEPTRDPHAEQLHRKLVSWFGDHPLAPFGVHRLVECGKSSGKKAGDWYGPSIVAHIIRKAVAKASELSKLTVYVAQDCTVYKGDVLKQCEPAGRDGLSGPSTDWKSVIILVPVRLGGETLNPIYTECVKDILRLDCCLGIIGGKPKHSLYFVGYQDDHLLYLDPHYCQSVVDVTKDNFPLESFHCNAPRKLPFSRMDPSCTIGFYAKNKKDFESLCCAVMEALTSSSSKEKYPIFTFVEGHGQDYGLDELSTLPPAHAALPPAAGKLGKPKSASTDDFVFL